MNTNTLHRAVIGCVVLVLLLALPLRAQEEEWPEGCELPDLDEAMIEAEAARADGDVIAFVDVMRDVSLMTHDYFNQCVSSAASVGDDLVEMDLSVSYFAGVCGSRCGYTDPTEQMHVASRGYANLWNGIDNINADALRWIYGHSFLFGYNDPEPPIRTSLNDFIELLRAIRQAFPDSQLIVVDIIMDGTKASIQFTWTGTHTETFEYQSVSLPPTNEVVTAQGVIIQSISSPTNFAVTKEIWYVDFPFLRQFEQIVAQ